MCKVMVVLVVTLGVADHSSGGPGGPWE